MNFNSFKRLLLLCLTCILAAAFQIMPALAAPEEGAAAGGTGWIQAHATVPEGFHGVVILTVENLDTLEEFDLECLSENGYVASASVPAGSYTVSMGFVYQNYTYNVSVHPADFIVKSGADSAAVKLNVSVEAGEEVILDSDTIPEIPTEELTEELTEDETSSPVQTHSAQAEESSSEEPDAKEMPSEEDDSTLQELIKEVLFTLLGALIFACLVFCVCWLYMRYRENNS